MIQKYLRYMCMYFYIENLWYLSVDILHAINAWSYQLSMIEKTQNNMNFISNLIFSDLFAAENCCKMFSQLTIILLCLPSWKGPKLCLIFMHKYRRKKGGNTFTNYVIIVWQYFLTQIWQKKTRLTYILSHLLQTKNLMLFLSLDPSQSLVNP